MATTSTTKKILTIDDEQSIVDLIVDILEGNNYTAISATKWTDAVDALNHQSPDLILLDLKMPTIHGTSMLDFIINENFDIPVVVVSGFVTDKVSSELRAQGVKGIVKKPFKARTLLDEIEKNLGKTPAAPTQNPDAINALYNRAATPLDSTSEKATPSMDALYGTLTPNTKEIPKPSAPPSKDILEALKKNAAKNTPSQTSPSTPEPDAFETFKKPSEHTPPPVVPPPVSKTIPPPSAPTKNGPPPVEKPEETPMSALPLSMPQSTPDFGRREHTSRPRRPRRKMDRGNMMFMGAITVVCLLVAGFLAIMQWVASEAPVAMEQIKSDLEEGVNAQMNQQMQQMKQQIQQQQLQQQINQAK